MITCTPWGTYITPDPPEQCVCGSTRKIMRDAIAGSNGIIISGTFACGSCNRALARYSVRPVFHAPSPKPSEQQ